MKNIRILRNIITIIVVLLFAACHGERYENSNTIEDVKTYSSEDKHDAVTVNEIRNSETGEVIYVVKQK